MRNIFDHPVIFSELKDESSLLRVSTQKMNELSLNRANSLVPSSNRSKKITVNKTLVL